MDHRETCRRMPSTMVIVEDDDILIEILLRLSTKSLVQLKSVCKRWRSLISSHHFSVLHTLRHPTTFATTANLILRRWRFKLNYPSLMSSHSYKIQFPFTTSGHIIQSCHDLLLCQSNDPWGYYYIYNLATRLWRSFDLKWGAILDLTLAFDPSKSVYYKLICVKHTCSRENYDYQIDVFDSKSSSWSVIVKSFTADLSLSNGIYWNNAIHWKASSSRTIYFDVDNGVIGTSPKVPKIPGILCSAGILEPLLVESGGHLHFVISDGSTVCVLELERDYSKWSIKYQVEYGGLSNDFSRLIGIVRTQNEEQSVLLYELPSKLMTHNLIDESFEELLELRENGFPFHHCDVRQFVETLAPV